MDYIALFRWMLAMSTLEQIAEERDDLLVVCKAMQYDLVTNPPF